ncbi:hypothetical protein [Thermovibrio ammonificans]|uniref:Type 4 fimbrial biogenesis protein PilX N-terminal domain-containing protein n=1 Tax=Thermovibrio ammonificans (strain DSM 15698 / JCM 12110 / HB-1) TaxID=648996 RepID=E8T2L2_THEA1|nr:hypothetical protein [Thermovibrio ammonificans]ADU97107.1 hypothetical protein Theam_1143 [Thermovibrio ammonificans HB-1]
MRRKGLALSTVLILSLIALGFTAVMLYMLTTGTKITGSTARYTSSLEVAKGVSSYLMRLMEEDELCNYTNCNLPDQPINLGSYSTFGDYVASARLLRRVVDTATGATVYAVEVKVYNKKVPNEKAVVDFVYKVQ